MKTITILIIITILYLLASRCVSAVNATMDTIIEQRDNINKTIENGEI